MSHHEIIIYSIGLCMSKYVCNTCAFNREKLFIA